MRHTVKNRNSEQGYTLVEMAVVMLVVGIIVSGGLFVWHLYKVEQRKELTEVRRFRISMYLEDFKALYGRYPCPARYDAVRGDVDYGVEGNCTDASVPPGACTNGYCVEESQRTVTMPDGTTVTPRVRRGAIPFRTLFIDEADSYDAYHARYSYAVTELLTRWQTFSSGRGGISVVDNVVPVSNSVVDPPHSALYFVFSHGSDNIGAYNQQGQLILPCNGPMLDNENCNTSPTETLAIYRSSTHSEVPPTIVDAGAVIPGGGAAVDANMRYDDNAYFLANTGRPIWRISDADRDNVHDVLPDASRRIIIGNAIPEQDLNVDDVTRLSASSDQSGVARTNVLCARDDANGDCFESYLIGGSGTNECIDDTAAYGVGDRQTRCRPWTDVIVSCSGSSGRFITGFNPDGTPICADINLPDDCPSQTVNMCGLDLVLNPAEHGDTQLLTAGASRQQLWRCNDGTWEDDEATGVCSCTPSTTVTTDACGPGYEGDATTTVTTVCPSGEVTTVVDRAECVCVPGVNTETAACPWPRTGTRTRTQTFICNAGGGSENWWSPWDESACVCPTVAPETQGTACPAPLTGSATRTRTRNMTSCSWNAWTYDYSGCGCNEYTQTDNVQCPSPLHGTIQVQRTLQCPSATWTDWTEIVANCSCNNSYGPPVVSECPPGQLGQITRRRMQDCHGTVLGDWETVSNTCQAPPEYRWVLVPGGSSGMSPTARPQAGDLCDVNGANGTCSVPGAGGGYYFRVPCLCQ